MAIFSDVQQKCKKYLYFPYWSEVLRCEKYRAIISCPLKLTIALTSGGAAEEVGTVNVCCSAFIMNHNAACTYENNNRKYVFLKVRFV